MKYQVLNPCGVCDAIILSSSPWNGKYLKCKRKTVSTKLSEFPKLPITTHKKLYIGPPPSTRTRLVSSLTRRRAPTDFEPRLVYISFILWAHLTSGPTHYSHIVYMSHIHANTYIDHKTIAYKSITGPRPKA